MTGISILTIPLLVCGSAIAATSWSKVSFQKYFWYIQSKGEPQAEVPEVIDDTDIMTSLTPKLVDYSSHYPGQLGIQVKNGVVTLTGAARNPRTKARAIADAESTRGVRSVIDRITVVPPPVPDSALRENVEAALKNDPMTSSYPIQVTASQGDVVLTGRLNTPPEKALAMYVAEGVDGVRSVRDNMTVSMARPTDALLKKTILNAIQKDTILYDSPIEVKVDNGKVELLGRVPSVIALRRATQMAWNANAASVDSTGLRIDPYLIFTIAAEKKSPPFQISDFDIWNTIATTFEKDPRVSHFNLDIQVKNGVATLGGTVGSLIARQSAIEDASNVRGVIEVKDKLKVQLLPGLSDAEVGRAIERSFSLHAPELLKKVSVVVRRGNVVLRGTVLSAYQKWLAWDSAARSPGVQSIRNEIQTNPAGPSLHPNELRDTIHSALELDALLNPADSIHVTVKGQEATLKGVITSEADRRRAREDASRSGV